MHINVNSNTDVIAAIPALFGFIPTNSIVALVFNDHTGPRTIHVSARYDAAAPLSAAVKLAVDTLPLRQEDGAHRHVLLIAIADRKHENQAGKHLDTLQRVITARGASIIKRLHTPSLDAGHTWADIDTGETGTTIDYRSSHIGLQLAVEEGRTVRATRDEIAEEFAPTDPAPAPDADADTNDVIIHTLLGLYAAFRDPASLTPQLAANVGHLITAHVLQRDALLITSTTNPQAAAAVWTRIARQLRGQARIEALAVAAACFYVADDTIRTTIALEAAKDTTAATGLQPTTLVTLLDTAVQTAVPPAKLRALFAQLSSIPPA